MLVSCRASSNEQNRTLPGDALIPKLMASWTHAITIASPINKVWQWLAQMGADRAGWYSYDFIDNGGKPSSTKILPQYQDVVVGQIFPAIPNANDAFVVSEIDVPHYIILTVPQKDAAAIVSWTFFLEAKENTNTRLLVRASMSAGWRALARNSSSGDGFLLINLIYRLLARLPMSLMTAMWGLSVGVTFLGLGFLSYGILFIKSKSVPLVFGWVGVLSGILISTGVWLPRYDESLYSVFVMLASPLGIWQLALGVWLVIKGIR